MADSARASPDFRWPNAEVPFQISNAHTDLEKQKIREAMDEIEEKTCVRFRKARESDNDRIRIVKEGVCASYVGRQGSVQDLSLSEGCFERSTILHEIMHALGFVHEHSRESRRKKKMILDRADRDEYVDIIWTNIKKGREHNFEKRELEDLTLMDTPYSYNSIMHYTSSAFAKYVGNKTIVAKEQTDNMGGGEQLSDIDVERIRKLYCSDKPAPPPPTTVEGFNFTEGSDEMMWSNGCDFTWRDIDKKQGSAKNCLLYCSANPKCSHFTWNPMGICYMKAGFSSNAKPNSAGSNVVCGYRKHRTSQKSWKLEHGVWWSYGCDFWGKDIGWSKATSQQCSEKCADNKDCTHFTWNPSDGGNCYLKEGHTEKPSCSPSFTMCGYDAKVADGGPFLCT